MARRRQRTTLQDGASATTDERSAAVAASGEHDEGEAFGPWLRRQREGREIELREIAESSKISLRYLQALEQGRFDVLPAPVFTKGFLRQYARYIGLDPEEVINAYLAARQAQEEAEEPLYEPPVRPPSRGAQTLRYIVVVLVLAVLLLGVVWLLGELRARQAGADPVSVDEAAVDEATIDGAAIDGAAVDGAAVDGAAIEGSAVDGMARDGAGAGAPIAETGRGDRDLETDASGGSARAPGGLESDPGSTAARAAAGDAGATPGADEAAANDRPASSTADLGTADASTVAAGVTAPLRIVLDFRADCWVEANLDGQRRLAELHIQGESLRIDATRWVDLKVGDHRAVRVQVNGEPFDLESGGEGRGAVRAVRFEAPSQEPAR